MGLPVNAQNFGDSKYKQNFSKADGHIVNGAFLKALPFVEELHSMDSSIANLNYMLGLCHLSGTRDYEKAIRYLEKATKGVTKDFSEGSWKEMRAPGITYLYLGRAYHFSGDYEKAVGNYYNYRSFIDIDDVVTYNQVRMVIKHAEYAMELTKDPIDFKIKNLGPIINSAYPDYAPIISADGEHLIFTSRRPGGITEDKDKDGSFYDDVYISRRKTDDGWGKPSLMPAPINTSGHDAAIGLGPDGQTLYLYKDDNGVGNIYFSELNGGEWTVPAKMGGDINTSNWETHVSISPENDMLVFTSTRSGGYGGRDLWYSLKLPDGSWGLAQNMGSVINTPFEEESPFLAFDGRTLFFSSQGHTSMGGFDIFRSEFVDGAWGEPRNLGYPLNTAEDDIFFILAADGTTAYFSSSRSGGIGSTDIYTVKMPDDVGYPMAVLRGDMVVPANDYVNLKSQITVKDATGAEVGLYRPNPKTGRYVLLVNPGMDYSITYSVQGYDPVTNIVSIAADKGLEQLNRPIDIDRVVFGEELLTLQELKRQDEEAAAKAAELAVERELQLAAEKQKQEEAAQLRERIEALERSKKEEVALAEQMAQAEADKAKELKKQAEEEARKAAEALAKQQAEEEARQVQEQRAAQEAAAKAEEDARKAAEALAKQQAEEEARQEQRAVQEAAAKAEQEARKAAEAIAKQQAEEEARQAQEQRAAQEAVAIAEEEARKAAETLAKQQAEEEARQAQEQRAAQEAVAIAEEEARKAAETLAKQNTDGQVSDAPELSARSEELDEVEESLQNDPDAARRLALQQRLLELRQRKQEIAKELVSDEKQLNLTNEESPENIDVNKEDEARTKALEEARQAAELLEKQEEQEREAQLRMKEEAAAKAAQEAEAARQEKEAARLEQEATDAAKKAEKEAALAAENARIEEERQRKAEQARLKAEEEARQAEAKAIKEAEEQKRLEEERALAARYPTLRRGSKGEKVTELQSLLGLEPDGTFGLGTQTTVSELQKKIGLKADGVVGRATWEAIESRKDELEVLLRPIQVKTEVPVRQPQSEVLTDTDKQRLQVENEALKRKLDEVNAKLETIIVTLSELQSELGERGSLDEQTADALRSGKKLILQNILFDYNKARLRGSSEKELDKLARFMRENADIKITVAGHTDAKGDSEYNLRLSRSRAQAVVNYVVSRGVDRSRLDYVGYGDKHPVARNVLESGEDNPMGRQLNRRIEISVTSGNADLIEVEEMTVPEDLKLK
jgi:outer membrane protein OmpA-like peptidoglycan-associated protein